ncbi:MAG: 3-hydroxyacyl-CoA dehydrogenase NAD-binding domain-containing protein [Bordetella sp.]|uniref:3-hydroxyacyl-CoA dehydrogenase NAD-binding domain-containing protein n=1 Tax=Bordetella sp. TaxID=28081 RepID=UPI003F7BA7EB
MTYRDIKTVGVVGTGLIGASWAAFFLACGFRVVATDPAPGAHERLREFIGKAWPALNRLGVAQGATPAEPIFVASLGDCVAQADFVQESGPERADIKRDTYLEMDARAAPDVILASSTSGFRPSQLQAGCRHPGRILVGHPFNPPHIVPLVEIVGSAATDPGALERAESFYKSLGKVTIRVRRELTGHVSNRLQAALWREAYHLVATGVVSAAEVDAAIAHGPGLRWALMGPMLLGELGGGAGGMQHFLDHIGPLSERIWAELGQTELTADVKKTLVESTHAEMAPLDTAAMLQERDRLLVDLINAKAQAKNLP